MTKERPHGPFEPLGKPLRVLWPKTGFENTVISACPGASIAPSVGPKDSRSIHSKSVWPSVAPKDRQSIHSKSIRNQSTCGCISRNLKLHHIWYNPISSTTSARNHEAAATPWAEWIVQRVPLPNYPINIHVISFYQPLKNSHRFWQCSNNTWIWESKQGLPSRVYENASYP